MVRSHPGLPSFAKATEWQAVQSLPKVQRRTTDRYSEAPKERRIPPGPARAVRLEDEKSFMSEDE